MSDYRVKVTVSNARIRRAIENAGFKTVGALCAHAGLSPSEVGGLVNMKDSPISSKTGAWRNIVLELSDALGVAPDDLFSESQRVVKLKTNTGYKDVEESSLVRIAASYINERRLEDLQENAAVEEIADSQVTNIISNALTVLKPRQQKILNMRFGLNGHKEMTLDEVAKDFNLSRDRIRQIEQQALRKLRGRDSAEYLRECSETSGW